MDSYTRALERRISNLQTKLNIAIEAINNLGEPWLYWPSKKQIEGQPISYESRKIIEIENLRKETLDKIHNVR